MAIIERDLDKSLFADKGEIGRLVAETNARMGFVVDPTVTAEQAQAVTAEALRRNGFRPENDLGSCDIVRHRRGTGRLTSGVILWQSPSES